MTIEVHNPELEALIRRHLTDRGGRDVEDILIEALRSAPLHSPETKAASRNLADILSASPFAGSELDLERIRDYPRPIDL